VSAKVAIAVAAHPDDVEFMMGGTLLLLKQAGWETHYLNMSSGNCGSQKMNAEETAQVRGDEAQRAAELLGATWHPGFSNDLEILYDIGHLRKLAAILHEVAPDVVLTHSPQDYMEDHENVSRRKRVDAGLFVDVTSVAELKLSALAAHESQRSWLDASQGLDSYLAKMEQLDREVGTLSGRFERGEGWRRHHHLGFSSEDMDPLADALGEFCYINEEYERNLDHA
jgi:LmbE family N-acetylglucosaminyl deacetylase